MAGGAGDDVYFVDFSTEVVTELTSEGTDTVNATSSFTLGLNVENLNLQGSPTALATATPGQHHQRQYRQQHPERKRRQRRSPEAGHQHHGVVTVMTHTR